MLHLESDSVVTEWSPVTLCWTFNDQKGQKQK